MQKIINWKDSNADEELNKCLDELVKDENMTIKITNIVSQEFIDMYNVDDPTDFNGWQCDWWSNMQYRFVTLNIYGCAFYGTISISKK